MGWLRGDGGVQKLSDTWALSVGVVLQFFTAINNEILSGIINILTITVLLVGLIDYFVRKIRRRRKDEENCEDEEVSATTKKAKEKRKEKARIFTKTVRKAHKSFRTLDLLEKPESAGNHLGDTIYHVALEVKRMEKMKKFFKWVWYNKEQLGSIAFSAIVYAVTIYLTCMGELSGLLWSRMGDNLTKIYIVKGVVMGVAALLTILTIRNTCVKYGLSSLGTIDRVLAEKAEAAAQKLSPEAKKLIKQNLAVLNNQLRTLKARLSEISGEYNKIKCLHDTVASLVPDYATKAAAYEKESASLTEQITTLEAKIKELTETLK